MECWKHISRRYEMPNLLLLRKGDYPLHRVPLYMKYLLEKNLKKRTVHSILLDVEEALSKKYLSACACANTQDFQENIPSRSGDIKDFRPGQGTVHTPHSADE